MASTGVKDPNLSDTLYVTELVAPMLVNTMPEKTMEAVFDHGVVPKNSITSHYAESESTLASVEAQGISISEVTDLLEREGVEKFIVSWGELVESTSKALEAAK
jgi:transaldolase